MSHDIEEWTPHLHSMPMWAHPWDDNDQLYYLTAIPTKESTRWSDRAVYTELLGWTYLPVWMRF